MARSERRSVPKVLSRLVVLLGLSCQCFLYPEINLCIRALVAAIKGAVFDGLLSDLMDVLVPAVLLPFL